MIEVFAASGFTPFAAIFPGFAYVSVFCEEYSSGYIKMIYSRMLPGKYALTRIVTVALSGGTMLAVPFIIALNYGEWYIFFGK
ncbi:MAG: hypothetical protein OSJ60_17015 [Lachnospiraceae bacterium]|nr:hypothetical protein C819_02101 [Lachnospiraceae bacterium 10-1]MCX4353315.1 hypothetical protein [Lachnospiraceae bacterium]